MAQLKTPVSARAMALFCFLMLAILAGIDGCNSGIGEGNLVRARANTGLTPNGEPDGQDNCPGVVNPVGVPIGQACADVSDCTMVLLATNPATGVSAQVGYGCLAGDCLRQADAELDGIGDVCDEDDDNDGIIDVADNCPLVANGLQENHDAAPDGGNACDDDDDNDGVLDAVDNCPFVANPLQENADGDGVGDACEDDPDGDAVCTGELVAPCTGANDNCPLVANPNQADQDGDGLGDVCDADADADGVLDAVDNCPGVANSDQLDTDGDGLGNACDDDDDNDGVLDAVDNCPGVPNPNQADTDLDGIGDACENDTDGDGYANPTDNCPLTVNPNQADTDGDGLGDACDYDCDGDGVNETQSLPNLCTGDDDGDGFVTPEDCLEGNPFVNPAMPDVCGDVADNDCDGQVNNTPSEWGCDPGFVCGAAGQCLWPECFEAAQCDDGDPATLDNCVSWVCENSACTPACEGLQCGLDSVCGLPCGSFGGGCDVDEECTPSQQCLPLGNCLVDADCPWLPTTPPRPQFCDPTGFCQDGQDLNGRTEVGESGADAGLWPDQSPDQDDLDGDCYCDIDAAQFLGGMGCLETTAAPGACGPVLGVGDCDDTPSGWGRNPGVAEIPGNGLDDNCDGFNPGD